MTRLAHLGRLQLEEAQDFQRLVKGGQLAAFGRLDPLWPPWTYFPLPPAIQADVGEQQHADEDVLHLHWHVEQAHAVLDEAQDRDAEHRPNPHRFLYRRRGSHHRSPPPR